jgi:uncharacterized protein YecE (DUF72 family)
VNPIHVGACGWAYPDWCGPFYPRGLPPAEFLTAYARRFSLVEVDSSFYQAPQARTVAGWRAKTPDGFRFSLKAPQRITHEKALRDCTSELDEFIDTARLLETKLQCCLLQFPYFNRAMFPSLDPFLSRLHPVLDRWPKDVPLAVEVRNAEWLNETLTGCLSAYGAALVLADIARMPSPLDVISRLDAVPASFAYVRLIGDRAEVEQITQTFDSIVLDRSERIRAVAEAIRALAGRVPVLVFVNNHFAGFAPETIRQLREALGLPVTDQDANWFFGGTG